jgi:hypothetical protein
MWRAAPIEEAHRLPKSVAYVSAGPRPVKHYRAFLRAELCLSAPCRESGDPVLVKDAACAEPPGRNSVLAADFGDDAGVGRALGQPVADVLGAR